MRARIDTPFEREVFRAGGILPFTLRAMLGGRPTIGQPGQPGRYATLPTGR